ncbi:MAG: polysaccharide biosynthesis/export family protein [Verrucomicrobiota bacterium]|jgi:hypothetical protein
MTFTRFNSPSKLCGVLLLISLLPQCTTEPTEDLMPVAPRVAGAPPAPARPVFLAGDQLELFVKEDLTLNGSYLVREGGYIVIPRAGRVNVAGLSREEAEPRVREFLLKTQLKEATVIVERTPSLANSTAAGAGGAAAASIPRVLIYITGSVPRTGGHAIPVPPGKTVGVYEALLISGGLGKFATLDKVEIFRFDANGRRKKSVIDMRPIMKGEAEDPGIAEGDIINVPEKVFGF